ncbi:MAG: hypothetical protein LC799_28385 [Actinobacteria bacterium]|nr:hypothetical protein [Actinomycetota bacterium]
MAVAEGHDIVAGFRRDPGRDLDSPVRGERGRRRACAISASPNEPMIRPASSSLQAITAWSRERARRYKRENYQRWERETPMALWQLNIVGGDGLPNRPSRSPTRGLLTLVGLPQHYDVGA